MPHWRHREKDSDPPERGALDDDFDGAGEPSVVPGEGVVDLYGSLGLVWVEFGDELIVVTFLEKPWWRAGGTEYACCGCVGFSGGAEGRRGVIGSARITSDEDVRRVSAEHVGVTGNRVRRRRTTTSGGRQDTA